MKNSMQDQLLKSGLVDEKKLKQHQRASKKQAKQRGKGEQPVDEIKVAAEQARAERAERDRESNRILQEQAQQKAVAAQIVQLIGAAASIGWIEGTRWLTLPMSVLPWALAGSWS